MSVQALSRITAMLALDAEMLQDFIPTFNEDGDDINEEKRAELVEAYSSQLFGNEIKDLLAAGDLNAMFQFLSSNLDKTIPTGTETDDGGTGGYV